MPQALPINLPDAIRPRIPGAVRGRGGGGNTPTPPSPADKLGKVLHTFMAMSPAMQRKHYPGVRRMGAQLGLGLPKDIRELDETLMALSVHQSESFTDGLKAKNKRAEKNNKRVREMISRAVFGNPHGTASADEANIYQIATMEIPTASVIEGVAVWDDMKNMDKAFVISQLTSHTQHYMEMQNASPEEGKRFALRILDRAFESENAGRVLNDMVSGIFPSQQRPARKTMPAQQTAEKPVEEFRGVPYAYGDHTSDARADVSPPVERPPAPKFNSAISRAMYRGVPEQPTAPRFNSAISRVMYKGEKEALPPHKASQVLRTPRQHALRNALMRGAPTPTIDRMPTLTLDWEKIEDEARAIEHQKELQQVLSARIGKKKKNPFNLRNFK